MISHERGVEIIQIMDLSKFMKYYDFLGRLWRCFGRLWETLGWLWDGFGGAWERQQIYGICDGLSGWYQDPKNPRKLEVRVWFGRPKTVDSMLDLGYWRQDPGDRIQDSLQDAGMYPTSAACWP